VSALDVSQSDAAAETSAAASPHAAADARRPGPRRIPAPDRRRPDDDLWQALLAVVSGTVRALGALLIGLLLTVGVGLLIWAVTPAAGTSPLPMLRSAVAADAAGWGLPVRIGSATLTLPPLAVGGVLAVLLFVLVRRGRTADAGAGAQVAGAVLAAAAHTVGLVVICALLAPQVQSAGHWWRPFLVALAVTSSAVGLPRTVLRALRRLGVPSWVPAGIRLGVTGTVMLLAGGAAAVVVGLVTHFSTAVRMFTAEAPGVGNGLGLTALNLGFLPNAVAAGTGWVTGAGFSVGGASFGLLSRTPAPLPAIPVLAAVPGSSAGPIALLALAVPIAAGVLLGRAVVRRVRTRQDRIATVAVAAATTGVLLGLVVALARGGVTGGAWSTSGANGLWVGLAAALELAVVGIAVAATAPAQAQPTEDEAPVDEPADTAEQDGAEENVAEPDVAEQDVADQEVAEQDGAEQDVAEPEVAEPEVAEPEVAEPEVAEPDAAAAPDPADRAVPAEVSDNAPVGDSEAVTADPAEAEPDTDDTVDTVDPVGTDTADEPSDALLPVPRVPEESQPVLPPQRRPAEDSAEPEPEPEPAEPEDSAEPDDTEPDDTPREPGHLSSLPRQRTESDALRAARRRRARRLSR
jgi:hypothetical protein